MTNGDDDLGRKTVLTFGTEVAAEHRSHRSTVDAAVERSETQLTSPELKTAQISREQNQDGGTQ